MTSVFPTIHDSIWDRYLRDSFDQIHWYILESARIRALEEFQRQTGAPARTATSATSAHPRPASAPATTTFATPAATSPFTVTVTTLPDVQQQQFQTPQQIVSQAHVTDQRGTDEAWNLSLPPPGPQPGSAGSMMSAMLRDVSNTSFSGLGFTTPTDSDVDCLSL